jgi:hypothetical protein
VIRCACRCPCGTARLRAEEAEEAGEEVAAEAAAVGEAARVGVEAAAEEGEVEVEVEVEVALPACRSHHHRAVHREAWSGWRVRQPEPPTRRQAGTTKARSRDGQLFEEKNRAPGRE